MNNEQPNRSGSFWSSYTTTVKVDVSDIRSVTMGILMDLRKDLKKAVKKYSDKVVKNHLDYCILMIDNAMKTS